jgi:hypothetical protein
MFIVLPRGYQVEDVHFQKLREFLSLDNLLTLRNVTAAGLIERVELGCEKMRAGTLSKTRSHGSQVILPCFGYEAMGEIHKFLTAQPRVMKYTMFIKLLSANHRTYRWSRNAKKDKRSVQERGQCGFIFGPDPGGADEASEFIKVS